MLNTDNLDNLGHWDIGSLLDTGRFAPHLSLATETASTASPADRAEDHRVMVELHIVRDRTPPTPATHSQLAGLKSYN